MPVYGDLNVFGYDGRETYESARTIRYRGILRSLFLLPCKLYSTTYPHPAVHLWSAEDRDT